MCAKGACRKRPGWSGRWWGARASSVCLGLALAPAGWLSATRAAEVPGVVRAARLEVAPGPAGFEWLDPSATGVLFTNRLTEERTLKYRNLLSGSGVAAGDFDQDGWCDLYFCGLEDGNRLYRNLGGWRFQDVTESAGVSCAGQSSTAAAFADTDGDGDLDLFVNGWGSGTRLFRNEAGRFVERTVQAGLSSKGASMSMAFADVDGDRDLDLYVTNFRMGTISDMPAVRIRLGTDAAGRPIVQAVNGLPATLPEFTNRFLVNATGQLTELGEADRFFLNDGEGHFTAVSFTGGSFLDEEGRPLAETPRDWGLAAQFYDFTGDGAVDLYVCNDLDSPDRIWIGDGRGRFRAAAARAIRKTSMFSMGVDFADIDRDGDADFFVTDMLSLDHQRFQVQVGDPRVGKGAVGTFEGRPQVSRNTLQMNRGDGTFAETAWYSRVEGSEWSWGPVFLDVDLDGYEDLLVPNGQWWDFQNADLGAELQRARPRSMEERLQVYRKFPPLRTANVIFRNRGGLQFEEMGAAWGWGAPGISQGMACADLDHDGDLDIALNNLNEPAGVYRNRGGAPRLGIRLRGLAPNTSGTGAKIEVTAEGTDRPVQSQQVVCAGRYLSGDDPLRVFAGFAEGARFSVEVKWAGGARTLARGLEANHVYEIAEREGSAGEPVENRPQNGAGHFENVSAWLGHEHRDQAFDESGRQPLLPQRWNDLGPGVAWADLNGDGWDDLLVGAGRNGRLAAFANERGQGFRPVGGAPFHRAAARDLTGVMLLGGAVYAGSSNYEDGLAKGGALRVFDLVTSNSVELLLGPATTPGPLSAGDVDLDGDLDLFVGGRARPGRYPEAADSLLLKNDRGEFTLAQRWTNLGIVNGAVLSNLDGTGEPELVLACEWGPVRVLERRAGQYVDATEEWGLASLTGWWRGVTTADFDEDGLQDLAVSNWGLNTRHGRPGKPGARWYAGDFDENGTFDVLETRLDPDRGEVPERRLNVLGRELPFVAERFTSYAAFGAATVEEILGARRERALRVDARTLASVVLLNRGRRFAVAELPVEAQLAPGFGITAGDWDGDAHEDLFVAQNFFATTDGEDRADAGRGVWLRGDGAGHFEAVAGSRSGLELYGEQRGCAAADFDQDGRLDLVVAQNGGQTQLWRNRSGRKGYAVRLRGSASNPNGIGAAVRLRTGELWGPAKEIHLGSGYWSSDSVTLVFGGGARPDEVEVRWPSGPRKLFPVPKDETWRWTITEEAGLQEWLAGPVRH